MTSAESALPELLPVVRGLSRADKLRLIAVLAGDLAREEGVAGLEEGAAYPIWTPYHAEDAAATLLRVLEEDSAAP